MQLADLKVAYKQNKSLPLAFNKTKAIGKALSVQVHTRAVCPDYTINGKRFQPQDYDRRFDDVFKYKLLNQYPNESDEMYNYRLSIYSPIQSELYARFITQATGTILNPNNYSIWSESDSFNNYIPKIESHFDYFLDFLLNNPISFWAVIQTNVNAGESSAAMPEMVAISAEHALMYADNSVLFKHNGLYYYIDTEVQTVLKEDSKRQLNEVYTYRHGFGKLPFWKVENKILDQFIVWCNEIVKSHSDSQIVDKNYSYPIKQVVEQECNLCAGRGEVRDDTKPDCEKCTVPCSSCNGSGTISMSPGQVHVIPEHYLAKYNTIPDIARFTTPDIGIPNYHREKWEVYYERAENSVHLTKRGSASESGEAKREDRKDSYFYMQTISQILFLKVIKPGMEFVGQYLTVQIVDSIAVHMPIPITIKEPRQFDLMGDIDLIEEVTMVTEKTDSPMLLGEMTYSMNDKLFSESAEMLKINEVLYLADPLYGISGNAEKLKMLSGAYTERDKWIHSRGYFALKGMLNAKGPKSFLTTSTDILVAELLAMAASAVPDAIIPNYVQL